MGAQLPSIVLPRCRANARKHSITMAQTPIPLYVVRDRDRVADTPSKCLRMPALGSPLGGAFLCRTTYAFGGVPAKFAPAQPQSGNPGRDGLAA